MSRPTTAPWSLVARRADGSITPVITVWDLELALDQADSCVECHGYLWANVYATATGDVAYCVVLW